MKKFHLCLLGGIVALVLTVMVFPGYAGKKELITIDGSSTVYPIAEAVSEEFSKLDKDTRITVGISGTGGGFRKFCRGEIDSCNASRSIKPEEMKLCQENGIEYIELPIAFDGLAVVVHPQNNWVKHLTVKELKKIWEPAAEGKITRWSQIRKGFPDKEIRLFGPGVASGTFDYFTEAIVGKRKASRGDYTSSEDDNVLVQGVATDKFALGYFGVAYYQENKDRLKAVAIDDGIDANGKGAFLPTAKNVEAGLYQPLSRPLLIYVNKKSLKRKEMRNFVEFYLKNVSKLAKEVGYMPLPKKAYELALERFNNRITGSVFFEAKPGMKVEEVLKKIQK